MNLHTAQSAVRSFQLNFYEAGDEAGSADAADEVGAGAGAETDAEERSGATAHAQRAQAGLAWRRAEMPPRRKQDENNKTHSEKLGGERGGKRQDKKTTATAS